MNLDKEPALREVMTYIKLHPEEWTQAGWACSTGGCLAGVATKLADDLTWCEVLHRSRFTSDFVDHARKSIGLSPLEASILFYSTKVCVCHGEFELVDFGDRRHPTYQEFEAHVSKVTGVKFKDGEEL